MTATALHDGPEPRLRLSQFAAVALVAGLQDRGLIAGGWRANRARVLEELRQHELAAIGDRWTWVAEAMSLLGYRGRALGADLQGIAPGQELAVQVLLLGEAERLEAELGDSAGGRRGMLSVISTLGALRVRPRLASRVAELEARAEELELTVGRVKCLEDNLDDLEAITRELYIGPRAQSEGTPT